MFISFLLSSLQQNIIFYETLKWVNLILITPGYKFPCPPSPRLIRIQLSQSELDKFGCLVWDSLQHKAFTGTVQAVSVNDVLHLQSVFFLPFFVEVRFVWPLGCMKKLCIPSLSLQNWLIWLIWLVWVVHLFSPSRHLPAQS